MRAFAGHLQMGVDGVAHRVGRPFLDEIDMRHLAGRMDAGIGAAGAAQRDLFAAKSLDRLLDRRLHRMLARLALPAGIEAAVIFDVEAVTRHS